MRQTLFYIPAEIAAWPVFGFGLLLAVWALASLVILGWLVRRQGFNADTQSYLPVLILVGAAIAFVMPAIAGDSQGLPVRGFGLMLLLAVLAGLGLAVYRGRQVGVHPDVIFSLAFWLFVSGIIGARLFFVVQKWDEFRSPGESLGTTLLRTLNVTQGGLVVYGSVIAAAAALVVFCRKHKLPALAMCDLVAPSMMLGFALGRIGCFLNGCCFGGVCDEPWGVTFPWLSPPHVRQVETGQLDLHGLVFSGSPSAPPIVGHIVAGSAADRQGLESGDVLRQINGRTVHSVAAAQQELLLSSTQGETIAIATVGDPQPKTWQLPASLPRSRPVHPTQLYSSIDALVLFLFLWAWYPMRRRDGELTALTITIYPVTRFLMEIIRTDELPVFLGMSISQNVSLLILAVAVGLWIYLARQPHGTAFDTPQPRSMVSPA